MHHALERQVVGDLVDREEKVLVGGSADGVRGSEELPAERVRVTEEDGGRDLKEDDGKDYVLGPRLVAHELSDLESRGACL